MYSCFFIGHRDSPFSIQEEVDRAVEKLVMECGVSEFIVGSHGQFDQMATAAVQRAVQAHPEKEIIALKLEPYFPGDREIIVPHYFDNFYYPDGMESVPPRFCIEKANRKVLDEVDFLVAYIRRDGGNAAKLYCRALAKQKRGEIRVINLGNLL